MALQTLKPQVPVDQDTDKVRGLEVLRSGTNPTVSYDDSASEWTVSDSLATPGSLTASGLTLTSNNTQNTSGDIQIRDDSSGDLYSLGGSGSVAKYEGSGAFTFGSRNTFVGIGDGSFAVGSGSPAASGVDSFSGGQFTEASGDQAFAFGTSSVAEGDESFSVGSGSEAVQEQDVAMGSSATADGGAAIGTFANGEGGYAFGSNVLADGKDSTAVGYKTTGRAYGGGVAGVWNEDYLGGAIADQSDPVAHSSFTDISSSDRIFAVGLGDDPDATSGDQFYFDGRGRVDGLYVTYRDGTHVRHGLSVDGYNASLGQYETVFEVDSTGTITKGSVSPSVATSIDPAGPDNAIQFNDNQDFGGSGDLAWDGSTLGVTGDVEIEDSDEGVILQSPNGTRFRVRVTDTGNLTTGALPQADNQQQTDGAINYDGETLLLDQATGQTAPLIQVRAIDGDNLFTANVTGDLELYEPGAGVILVSDDGTERRRVKLSNSGTLQTETL